MIYFWPKGLAMVPWKSTILASIVIGVFGFGVGFGVAGGFWEGQPIRPNLASRFAPLAAAPIRLMPTLPVIDTFSKLYAPPPYKNVTLLKTPPLTAKPSNETPPPFRVFSSDTMSGTDGMTGTAPGYWIACACRTVEVWIGDNGEQRKPATNDTNATMTFLITPPAEGKVGNCSTWVYHYGTAPSKQSDSRPQTLLVGSPEGQPLLQSSTHDLQFPLPSPG
jgi:hypothetical protein